MNYNILMKSSHKNNYYIQILKTNLKKKRKNIKNIKNKENFQIKKMF